MKNFYTPEKVSYEILLNHFNNPDLARDGSQSLKQQLIARKKYNWRSAINGTLNLCSIITHNGISDVAQLKISYSSSDQKLNINIKPKLFTN